MSRILETGIIYDGVILLTINNIERKKRIYERNKRTMIDEFSLAYDWENYWYESVELFQKNELINKIAIIESGKIENTVEQYQFLSTQFDI